MTRAALRERFGRFPNGVAVPWVAVAVMAVTMSFVDGFWIISLREAALLFSAPVHLRPTKASSKSPTFSPVSHAYAESRLKAARFPASTV